MQAVATLLVASLCFLILSCQSHDAINNDKPAIKAISFVGIPPQDVHFDARNARITVKLPAVLKGGLQPIFELAEGTQVLSGVMADNTIDLSSFCTCYKTSRPGKVVLRVGNQKATAVYEVEVIATGPLQPQDIADQFTFSRNTKRLDLRLPVENLYQNPFVNTLQFKDVTSGKVINVSADAACLNGCSPNAPNQMTFSLVSPIENLLLPGIYTIGFNGVSCPQRLVVTE